MNELTYILGAGASYQSIPLVKSFANRFNVFLNYLSVIVSDPRFSNDKREKFKQANAIGEKLLKAFESHQSFDTYFKKLFHTNQIDKINEAKKILNLYFMWEHLALTSDKPNPYSEFVFWKQSVIDKRYDALVAGLLKPLQNQSEPYCKVNFITWNYDLNLLISLKNYYLPNGTFKDFFKSIEKQSNKWGIEEQICVFNMNGFFYSSQFDNLKDLENAIPHEMIYSQITDEYFNDSFVDKDASLIKFAWETENQMASEVRGIINNSNNIVVIGYTFPLYNRLVDLQYLEKGIFDHDKKFILQDPNADNLRTTFLEMFDFGSIDKPGTYSMVATKKDCDYFYVPSNIYTK